MTPLDGEQVWRLTDLAGLTHAGRTPGGGHVLWCRVEASAAADALAEVSGRVAGTLDDPFTECITSVVVQRDRA
ncbi:hypothetical protein [Thermobispora bispora]|uniref:hypothetical protein n=1 Tax=Thermobispora bispora TaxID=2006 RepID=UPI00197EC5A7|nr:hypothetical protein [Thermobispora bispora]